jgi:hypothetical protein
VPASSGATIQKTTKSHRATRNFIQNQDVFAKSQKKRFITLIETGCYALSPTPPLPPHQAATPRRRGGQCSRQTPTTSDPGTGTSTKSA